MTDSSNVAVLIILVNIRAWASTFDITFFTSQADGYDSQ